ncbi:MAG: hypothetical protein HEQ40_10030 [Lacibacter sp.]
MECRIAAAVQLKPDCGCDEKLMASTEDASQSSPLHQHHLKNYTEEFFHTVTIAAAPVQPAADLLYAPAPEQRVIKRAYSVFQPPRI